MSAVIDKSTAYDIAYIAGIFKNRVNYWETWHTQKCKSLVARCLKAGAEYDRMLGEALVSKSWTDFQDTCEEIIDRAAADECDDRMVVLRIGDEPYLVPEGVRDWAVEVGQYVRNVESKLHFAQFRECAKCGYEPNLERSPTCAGRKTNGDHCMFPVREWGDWCHIHADKS